ncbi:MAG: D-alanyl-D-alanine carboxypeptidase [Treponema sp.]|nr:D-alanyl-D-alanine carboxypeptidase [Treponema sp.]
MTDYKISIDSSDDKKSKKGLLWGLLSLAALLLVFLSFTAVRAYQYKNFRSAAELSEVQLQNLQDYLQSTYSENYEILQNLPYSISKPNLDVWAKSAILLDTSNGNIIYEKNADEIIPPASMTKLFSMYVVEQEIEAGNLSYDDIIPLPPESWACNMPPHSSLMFLGEGQRVTLEELLLGLSICSGNDAAYALAYTICGNMEDFVERMNKIAEDLGLENTHFVESSGYSELNTTTAREMAAFCCKYLQKYPESLARYHSVQKFTYPKERNLAPGDSLRAQDFSNGFPRHITMSITQRNTNPLLGILDGVDGLKTGYIDESGYNLSLTARRNGNRFLSVTMGGPGNSSSEGQAGRVHDGKELMNWAFKTFADFDMGLYTHPYFVKAYCASEKGINIVPAYEPSHLTVPYISGDNVEESVANVKVAVDINKNHWGAVEQGEICGYLRFYLDEYLLQEIPLVADRDLKKANFIIAASDKLILKFLPLIQR